MTIYKRHEFSLSQNGNKIIHIARNAAGIVVFRANSEEELKKIIDDAIRQEEHQTELNLKKKLASDRKKKEIQEKEKEVISQSPQKPVTRGPDGKFISKSKLDQEEPKKKNFWNKLTS